MTQQTILQLPENPAMKRPGLFPLEMLTFPDPAANERTKAQDLVDEGLGIIRQLTTQTKGQRAMTYQEDEDKALKEELLRRAKAGLPKPDGRTRLGRALKRFTHPDTVMQEEKERIERRDRREELRMPGGPNYKNRTGTQGEKK